MFDSILYLCWFLLPTIFFGAALWTKLESVYSGRGRAAASDLFKQGVFTLVCVFVALFLDKAVLPSLSGFIGEYVPAAYLRILVLPAVLYAAALAYGPSPAIRISKPSRSADRGKTK